MEALNFAGKPKFVFVVGDDGSTEPFAPAGSELPAGARLEVVRLHSNQGHQRAIALALAHVERSLEVDAVLIMDSDGEDQPADAMRLLGQAAATPGTVICARRAKRSEGLLFRVFYALYLSIFKMMTGVRISFGNFMLIPQTHLSKVLYSGGIWNHLAASVLRSRVPIQYVSTNRGARYSGESHMNFVGLVVHGISAISVFSEVVIARIVIFLTMLLGALGLGILVTLAIKFQGGVFIPGYATNVILFMTNMIITSLFVGFALVLMLLNNRVMASSLPTKLFDDLVARVDRFGCDALVAFQRS